MVDDDPGEAAYEFVLGVVRRVDWDRLDEYQRDPRFRGVLHSLDDGVPQEAAELARRGIPVDLRMGPGHLPLIARIVEAAPELRVAIDDLANPAYGQAMTDEWALGMEEAARFPQVYCKASSMVVRTPAPWKVSDMRPFVQHALAVFGPERVMFGSGWPACLPAAGWKECLAAFTQSIGAQTMEVREELLGGTAARFYGIR